MTGPQRFRKSPVEVEAVQWDGTNYRELFEWTDACFWETDELDRVDDPDATGALYVAANSVHVGVVTGEWIIRDKLGFYPCKPDIFDATYEPIGASA